MPTYEYECSSCGKRFDAFQSITEKPLKKCELCGKRTVRRLISAGAGLIFKGSGFYITDYKSKGAKDDAAKAEKAEKSDTKSDAKPESKTDSTSADSKPAAKSEPKPSGTKPGKKQSKA